MPRSRDIPFGWAGTRDFLLHPYARIREIYFRSEIAPIKPRLGLTDDPYNYLELRQTRIMALRVAWRLMLLVAYTALQQFLLVFGYVLPHRIFRPRMTDMYLSIRIQERRQFEQDIAKQPEWYARKRSG